MGMLTQGERAGASMINPFDAWVLRRLLVDLPVNGEIDVMSGVPRLMADHLAVTPLQERQPAWDAMVALQDDSKEIVLAVAATRSSHWVRGHTLPGLTASVAVSGDGCRNRGRKGDRGHEHGE